nr:hypothetical protein [Tanacetum cinerariifolium]
MSRANPQAAIVSEEQLVPSENRPISKKNNQRMPPSVANKPYTKPPIEKQILAFIKTLGYDEDPKEKMTSVSTFVATRHRQPWRAILSDEFKGKAVDRTSRLSKDTSSTNTRRKKVRKVKLLPKEQHVSPIKSGRGKGYMRLDVAVELAKSVSIEEQQLQQWDIISKLKIKRQIIKDVEDTYAEWGQKLKGPVIEDPSIRSLLDLRRESKKSILESLWQEKQPVGGEGSNTNEEKDEKIDDFDMDLSANEPQGDDDDDARFGVFVYKKSIDPLISIYLSPTVTCSSLKYIQSLLNEPPAHELTDFMSNLVYTNAYRTSVVANPVGNPEATSYISEFTSSQSKEAHAKGKEEHKEDQLQK